MKERPILFSGPMVKAILDGRKTQTRRVVKFASADKTKLWMSDHAQWKSVGQAKDGSFIFWDAVEMGPRTAEFYNGGGYTCPYGQVGDRLWVRETFVLEEWEDEPKPMGDRMFFHHLPKNPKDEFDSEYWLVPHFRATDPEPELWYEDDPIGDGGPKCKWRPSIFMPRWASRITLEVVNVRVERLQDITEEDARAEGVVWQKDFGNGIEERAARPVFGDLWHALNDKRGYGWNVNPWVWVIEFKKI